MIQILQDVTSNRFGILVLLLFSAALEAGGDSFFQVAMHRSSGMARVLPSLIGAFSLIFYGVVVNLAPWDFGRLLGIYVVFFFLVSQAIAWSRFREVPSPSILIGGFFIVLGGAIIGWAKF